MYREQEYDKEIKRLYSRYEDEIRAARSLEEALPAGVRLLRAMDELNIRYGMWNGYRGYDHDAIYYTAEYLVRKGSFPEIRAAASEAEEYIKAVAARLFERIDHENRKRIHVVEPHPDDALGSTAGLCYSGNVFVTLHTICCVYDDRDSVCMELEALGQYHSVRKKPNIVKQHKYNLKDCHWDCRYTGSGRDYGELVQQYRERYGEEEFGKLVSHIRDIVETAAQEQAYIAFPLGIEHPMHMLTAYTCIQQVKRQGFDLDRVIVYVDHPYDFLNAGNGRLQNAREYMHAAWETELCRCDDLSVNQSIVGKIIAEIYGESHFGEFAGSLENTFCSYFINSTAVENVRKFLDIHMNNILYITAQAKPFWKTGGSGEVAYGLCKALQDFVNDVRIMMPKYSGETSDNSFGEYVGECRFTYTGSSEAVGNLPCVLEERRFKGLTYYLLDIEGCFNKENLFDAGEHGKNFAVFCDAVLQKGLVSINYMPTVLHCNDWQTALIPMLKKTKYASYHPELKVIYTIHFYGYKGIFNKKSILGYIGLDENNCRLCISCDRNCPLDKVDLLSSEDMGKLSATLSQMSFMKAGIEFADVVSTVSKGYAGEIQEYPDFSGVRVFGVRNGIGPERYTFAEESGFVDISRENFAQAKRINKARLQQNLGLDRDLRTPVLCMVSRLATVKGIEVLKTIVGEILSIPAQLVVVGDDDDRLSQPYARYFQLMEEKYKGRFAYRGFSEEREYQTYAGADMLLMPSVSEACGTTQMNAMRYGVVPIVSMISAFRDTVLDFKDREKKEDPAYWDKGIGFYAYREDCWVLLEVIKKAVEIYRNEDGEDSWNRIAEDCICVDFGWRNGSVRDYLLLYHGMGLQTE